MTTDIDRPSFLVATALQSAAFSFVIFGRSPLGKGSCAGESYGFAALGLNLTSEDTMSIILNAQPYDMTAGGFYFRSAIEFVKHFQSNRNDQGDPVEEYEIQFIDGEDLDCALAKAIGLNQVNFADFLELTEAWEDWEKINTIIAIGECGYDFDPQNDPDHYGIEIYAVESLRELAEQFVGDGLFGEIPESLQFYIDHDAVARDLAMEYSETAIAGETYVYRCS